MFCKSIKMSFLFLSQQKKKIHRFIIIHRKFGTNISVSRRGTWPWANGLMINSTFLFISYFLTFPVYVLYLRNERESRLELPESRHCRIDHSWKTERNSNSTRRMNNPNVHIQSAREGRKRQKYCEQRANLKKKKKSKLLGRIEQFFQ